MQRACSERFLDISVFFVLSAVDHCSTEILMTFRVGYLGSTLKILHDL